MIDNDEPIVRIAYLEMDRAPQTSGYEAFHAILDPAPSARWRAAFERLLETAPSLLRGATFRSFRGNVTVWVTAPEQSMSAAVQGLKSMVMDVSARTSLLETVRTKAEAKLVGRQSCRVTSREVPHATKRQGRLTNSLIEVKD